jgi:Rrf2 family protein
MWLAAKPDQRHAAGALALRTKIPRRYLHKVIQLLVQAGLVDSQPGPGGGYALAVLPASLAILTVVNAVSPLERIRRCPLHRELDRVYAEIEKAFARVSVANLLNSTSKIIPLCDVTRA